MKRLTLLLLAFAALMGQATYAQKRFSVAVTAAPVLNHSSVRQTFILPDANGQLTPTTFDITRNSYGRATGLLAKYLLRDEWSVSAGLWYNRFTTPNIFSLGTNLSYRSIAQTWQIPLFLNYQPGSGRLKPVFSLGVMGSVPTAVILRPEAGSGQGDIRFGSSARLSVQPVLGVGTSYRLTDRWSVGVQPLLIWRFRPRPSANVTIERYVSYQLQVPVQVAYSF